MFGGKKSNNTAEKEVLDINVVSKAGAGGDVASESELVGVDSVGKSNAPITGHGAFAVSVVPEGVAIHAGFIADGTQELLALPAVFPNIESALTHLDDLRRLVIMHFGQIAATQDQPLPGVTVSSI